MPHPLEVLTAPVSLIVFAIYGGLTVLELVFPARSLPPDAGARVRGTLAFLLFFFVSSYLPIFWDGKLSSLQLADVTAWPTAPQALLGLVCYELIGYGYHRLIHRYDVLFRLVHQTHHTSERIDVPSAYYFHPLDMVGWTFVTSLGLVAVLGLSPEAATWVVWATSFLSAFQHANLKTPRWLGYVVQRPESHSRHHERGYHRNNYADLPVIDLLFGTFENPARFSEKNGLFDGGSRKILPLLFGGDLSARGPERPRHDSPDPSLGAGSSQAS